MTGLEIAGAVVGLAVGLGTLCWGAVAGVRWIAETVAEAVAEKATTPLVVAMSTLSTEVRNMGEQLEKLWKKSDDGEQTHRDHEGRLKALEAVRAPEPKPRRKRAR